MFVPGVFWYVARVLRCKGAVLFPLCQWHLSREGSSAQQSCGGLVPLGRPERACRLANLVFLIGLAHCFWQLKEGVLTRKGISSGCLSFNSPFSLDSWLMDYQSMVHNEVISVIWHHHDQGEVMQVEERLSAAILSPLPFEDQVQMMIYMFGSSERFWMIQKFIRIWSDCFLTFAQLPIENRSVCIMQGRKSCLCKKSCLCFETRLLLMR